MAPKRTKSATNPAGKKATKKPGAKKPAATKSAVKKSGQKTMLSDLAPDAVVNVLGFFRSVERGGFDVLEAPQEPWEDVAFVEERETLANVLNFALCSRATRDIALGDGVWAPHCAAMEVNLAVGPREWEVPIFDDEGGWTYEMRVLPEELVDPRALDPRGYASLSALKRYWAVRSFHDRIRQTLEEFGDKDRWDDFDWEHLNRIASFCFNQVQARFEDEDDIWADIDGEWDEEQMEEAFDCINPFLCARLALKSFVLPEFNQSGVSGHARDILLGGWPKCLAGHPCSGTVSFAEFLRRLTGFPWPC